MKAEVGELTEEEKTAATRALDTRGDGAEVEQDGKSRRMGW